MNYSPIMQRNNFFCPGPQNSTTLFAYQPTLQNNANYPEIVGEGDVTSVVLPNGSVQYFFIPNYKRDVWTPFAYNPAAANWNFTTQAWFVRSMPNPIPTSFCYGQHLPSPCEGPLITSFTTPDFTHTQALGFNTFHYDKWTSTTDLCYFFPNLCLTSQQQKCTASVQIDTPAANTVCHYQVVCNKPCHCAAKVDKKLKSEAEKKSMGVECCMSVEKVKEKVTCECPSYCQISDNSVSMDTRSSGTIGRTKKKLSFRKKKVEKSDRENKRVKRKKNSLIKIIGKCDGTCCCSSSNVSTEAE